MMGTDGHQSRPTGKTNLMAACEQGRTLEVKIILQKKPLAVASRDRNGKTALHYCAESGSAACTQLIVSADPALINQPDEDGFAPLHLAIIAGNRSVAKLLLKHGADPDRMDKERHSTVHWASVCGDLESLDLLLNYGANPSSPDILGAYPIHYAAQMCGAHSLNGKDPETGLNILKKLVQRGASIQCRDRDGREPLLWAASTGSSEAVLILFAAGASVTSADKDGLTALHCAASRGHMSCVETLVTLCGARINAGDSIGCSPIFYAAAQGHADSVQILLKYSADPSLQDDKGRTPAHCAASKGQLEILRILDSNGADLWIRNSRGNLPLHEAVQSGRKDLVQWLLGQCPRAVNATNINGRTPLHIAAQKNNVEMCEVLIDYGAHINPLMVNAKGFLMSPLDVAVYQGNQRCAKYLQLHGAVPATKVLENNEINRNLLFSLGNYAYSQKERSDEELASVTTFEQMRGLVQTDPGPILPRDTHTRTIRAGQQPPLPQVEVPPESLLTNVTSENITDASVHIHLSRDDLWLLWESLMQELTSEMSEDKEGSEASSEGKVKKSSEVRQLKPILTNVYLRTSSTRNQQDIIAGESIMDKNIIVGVTDDEDDVKPKINVDSSRRRRHSRSTKEDLKTTLPKVTEVENSSNLELDDQTNNSGHDNSKNFQEPQDNERTDWSAQNDCSDSVGSDTEHRSALTGTKTTRLRKRRSDGRIWGREPEESETSSGHRPEQREANPYLKRYFQKQARAAEVRNHISGMNDEDRQQTKGHKSYKHVVRKDYDDAFYSKHRRGSSDAKQNFEGDDAGEVSAHKGQEIHKKKHRRKFMKEDVNTKDQSINDEREEGDQTKSGKRRSRASRNHAEDYKASRKIKCECMSPVQGSSLSPKSNSENNGEEYPGRVPISNRRGSTQFLEVPRQTNTATANSDGESKSEEREQILKNKLHHHYHHHHHHHHHHHPLEKEASLHDEYQHFSQHRRHRRHYHRKRSRLRDKRGSTDTLKDIRNLSDGEYNLYGRENRPSSVEEKRSKSEMSGFPRLSSKDTLSANFFKTPIIAISDDESKYLINEEDRTTAKDISADDDTPEYESGEKPLSFEDDDKTLKNAQQESVKNEHAANNTSQDLLSVILSDHGKSNFSAKEIKNANAAVLSKRQEKSAPDKQKEMKNAMVAAKSQDKKPESQTVAKKSESMSKARSSKKTEKAHVEKSGVRRISLGTKKRSPKKEIGKSAPKPLKTAHSLSELLPNKANDKGAKQKSRSAQIQKSSLLPDIRLFSVEGDPTYLLHKEEANISADNPQKISKQTSTNRPDNECKEESASPSYLATENETQRIAIKPRHENEDTVGQDESLNYNIAAMKQSEKKSNIQSDSKSLKSHDNGMKKTELPLSSGKSRRMSVTITDEYNETDAKSDDVKSNQIKNKNIENEENYSKNKNFVDPKSSIMLNDDVNLDEVNITSKLHSRKNSIVSDSSSTENEANLAINNFQTDQKLESMSENNISKESTEKDDVNQGLVSDIKELSDRSRNSGDANKAFKVNKNFTNANLVEKEKNMENIQQISFPEGNEKRENRIECFKRENVAESCEKVEENGNDDRLREKYQHDEEDSLDKENDRAIALKNDMFHESSDQEENIDITKHKMEESKDCPGEILDHDEKLSNTPEATEFINAETDTQPEYVDDSFDKPREEEISLQTDQITNEDQFVAPENATHIHTDESASEAETRFETDESDEIQPEPDITKLLLPSEGGQVAPSIQESNASFPYTKEAESEISQNELADQINDTVNKNLVLDSDDKLTLYSTKDKIKKGRTESIKSNSKEQEVKKASEPIQQPEELPQQFEINDKQISPKLSQTDGGISNHQHLESTSINEPKPEILRRDMSSQTFSIREETDFTQLSKVSYIQTGKNQMHENDTQSNQNNAEIHRSISVQTMNDLPLQEMLLNSRGESMKNTEKIALQNTVSVQTDELLKASDSKGISVHNTNINREDEKHESDKTNRERKSESVEITEKKTKSVSTKFSPTKHNPSSVFYHTKTGETSLKCNGKAPETKTHNRGALFYTTPAIRERNMLRKSDSLTRSESLEKSNKYDSENKTNRRPSIRDRSLESEKAVAIANSAFRKLNSNGELTVFNSSQIMPNSNNQNGSSFHFDDLQKSSCQRHGEYPSLEKPGFLWVHFGSGSSPIHTLKRKPAFTSQKLKREKTITVPEKTSRNDKSTDKKPSSIITLKNARLSKKQDTKENSKNVKKAEEEKIPQRKGSIANSIPPLQITSKELTDKNTEKSMAPKGLKKKSYEQTPEKLTKSMYQASHLKTSKVLSEKSGHRLKADASALRTEITTKKEAKASKESPNTSFVCQEKTLKTRSRSPRKGNLKNAEDATTVEETGNGRQEGNKNDSPKRGFDSSKVPKDDENKGNKDERLIGTAMSSSFEEGDLRLVIERKTDPGVSIKIQMKDVHKNKGKHTEVADLSSTQGESDQSYVKDSGYISTSESIHKDRRSITIDLGHTTAKINAGVKSSLKNVMSKEKTFLLPSVSSNGEEISQNVNVDNVQVSEKNIKKTIPSKLPILEPNRQRSNSLVFMDYNRSPRRDSQTSSEISVESFRSSNLTTNKERSDSWVSTLHVPGGERAVQSGIQRQTVKSSGRSQVSHRRSSIPIYKAYSDGNLHSSKPFPRLTKHSLSTPSVHKSKTEGKTQSSPRKMSSIRELSSSTAEKRHSDTDIHLKSAEKLKLPSILLYEPEDSYTLEKETGEGNLLNIPRSHGTSKSKRMSPVPDTSTSATSDNTRQNVSLKLPLLQQVVRCRCNIQPHQDWDGRRTRSAVDCVANIHFLSEEEMAQFDSRFSPLSGRKSFSGGRKRTVPHLPAYRALKTQTLKRLNAGRLSADKAVTFHVDHARERNTFKLPTEKLERNKKWQVVFTIAKSKEKKQKAEES